MKTCRPVFSMHTAETIALKIKWAKRLVELATKLEQTSATLPHQSSRILAGYKNPTLLEQRWTELRKRRAKRSPRFMMTKGQSIFYQAMEGIILSKEVCGSKRSRRPKLLSRFSHWIHQHTTVPTMSLFLLHIKRNSQFRDVRKNPGLRWTTLRCLKRTFHRSSQ